jgi:hypothetical protein
VVVGERQGGKRVGGSKSGSPKSGSGMVGRGSLSSTKIVAPRNGSNRVHATTGGDWCKGWKSGSYDVVVGGRVGWRWSCCRRCVAGVPQEAKFGIILMSRGLSSFTMQYTMFWPCIPLFSRFRVSGMRTKLVEFCTFNKWAYWAEKSGCRFDYKKRSCSLH